MRSKYSQKRLDYAKQSATDVLKTASKKTAEAAGDIIGNKIADRAAKVSKTLPQNNPETNEEEILREGYISPEKRRKIIDNLRLIHSQYIIKEYQKIINLLDNTENELSKFRTRNWVE